MNKEIIWVHTCMACGNETEKNTKRCPHCGGYETIWSEENPRD